jgi:hypothetical protein
MANPHADQTATVFNNGNVLIAGGQNYGQGSILEVEESAAAELYEYATGTWTSVGNMTTARDYAGAALLSNGTVLVAGGAVGGCCSGLSSAEIFDSTTLTWTAIQSMTTGRNGPAASAILNATSVLVSGGYSCCSDPNPTLSSAEDYDVATQSWNLTGSLSQARSFFTSVTLHDGTVLAVGGDFSSAERYYPDANNQTVTIQISNTGVTPVSFSITGTGCSAGTYTSYGKFALNWIPGSSCQVTASAPSGWSFTNWSDGSTANPRTFIVPSVATTYTANFSQSSATPASISATGGTPQSTAVSTAFASPLVAAVENSSGNPVSGVTVTFAAPGSGASGTFAGGVQAATTNAAGVATAAAFTANATAGSYTVTASVAGVSTPARFKLTNQAGSATSATATGGTPQSTAVSTAFASPLVVAVENSSGNPVSGVTVTFAAPGSGASGTFAGGVQTARTNAAGVATSAVFKANATAGSYTVTASVAGVSTPASFALTNTAGKAASISATGGTPQSTAVSTAFASPLVVAVENSSGNPVSGVTVTFAAPGSGASGTFAGGVQAATTNAAGVATSAVFTANATAGSYTVTASVAGVSTPASFALTNTVIGGQSTTITLLPSSYVTTQGTSGGQAVSTSIDLLDESGTENIWNKYVEFDGLYAGYQVFTLPPSIVPSSVTNIQIQVNYQGPAISTQTWTWQIYDWVHAAYVSVGTNSGAPDWGTWKLLTFSVPGTLSNYIRSSDGQVRIQLLSNNSADAADIDYEAVIVSY